MKKIILLTLLILNGFLVGSAKPETKYRNSISFAYSPVNSVFEDDNIVLQIYNGKLYARNKTEKTIFIDLSQCFLINNGSSYPMYSSATNEKYASKARLSSSIDEFISIAPFTGSKQNETFIANLTQGILGKYTTTEGPMGNFSDYEIRFLTLIDEMVDESLNQDPKKKEYLGTSVRHLTEDESINNIGASIAYAFNKRAEEWTNVTISTWVSDVIFAPYFVRIPDQLSKKERKGFNIKETESAKIYIKAPSPFEFDQDKSPIVVVDWEGDFKKGTFRLRDVALNSNKETMKTVINYEGDDTDWGDMKFAKYGNTSQEGIHRATVKKTPTGLSSYEIKYIKMSKSGNNKETVRTETVQATKERLEQIVSNWENQTNDYKTYICTVKKID